MPKKTTKTTKKETPLNASVEVIMEDLMEDKDKFAVFREMSKIDGIDNFFRALKKVDILNYFNSQKEAHDTIRGHYSALSWLHDQIRATRSEKKEGGLMKPPKSPRHE